MNAELDTTVLSYVLSPSLATANTRVNFALVATNGASELRLTPDDEIYVNLPVGPGASDLTPDLDSINPQAPSNWRCSKNSAAEGYNFVISPLQELRLAANASLLFQFQAVIVNPVAGIASVDLREFIGSGDASRTFPVTKGEAVFSVVAQALPSTVGLNQATTLKWTSVKAAYVTVSPLPGQFPAVGQLSTVPTQVLPGAQQVVYTVTAWTPDQQRVTDIVAVTVSKPVIEFGPQHCEPITYDAEITLQWNVSYATQVMLTLPDGVTNVPAVGQRKVKPKSMLQGNQDTAVYTLRAFGTGAPVDARVSIPFEPVRIDYFRYPRAGVTDTYEFSVSNGLGNVDMLDGDQGRYFQLTATGPLGPLVEYLGAYPALQIQLFLSSANQVAPGSAVTLQWQTVHAVNLALSANGAAAQPVAPADIASGSLVVQPTASTHYVLSATDAAGETITSSLDIQVAQ